MAIARTEARQLEWGYESGGLPQQCLTAATPRPPFGVLAASFVRVQSTACEQQNLELLLRELDANLLVNLALGHRCASRGAEGWLRTCGGTRLPAKPQQCVNEM